MHRIGGPTRAVALVIALVGPASAASAQTGAGAGGADRLPTPTFEVSVGFGNVRGFVGGSVERFIAEGGQSFAVGVGRFPSGASTGRDSDPWFTAFGAAYRKYFGSGSHQASVEASVSMVNFSATVSLPNQTVGVDRHYGPGLAVGYRYTTRIGLHFDVSGGIGRAVGVEEGSLEFIGGLAVGYTWH
jgi:hypothetical protein